MSAEAAVELVRLMEGAGIETWLDGGWAIDVILGEQTRVHADLDIILHEQHLPRLRRLLSDRGFAARRGGSASNFVLADGSGLEVDVHAIVFNGEGDGLYRMADGETWVFPAAGFTGRGVIRGLVLRCLSAEVQVLCRAHGYVPAEKDFRDMELLSARFGVELPSQLRREAGGPIRSEPMDGVTLRKAGRKDGDFAYRARRAAFREYVEKVRGWDEEGQRQLHERRFVTQDFRVISLGGADIGIMATVVAPECVKVNQLVILPEHQGKGIGRKCMLLIMEEARRLGLPVRLRVLKVNLRALVFYWRQGFVRTGDTDTHVLMERGS